jgi:hypothetical protein
MRPLRQAALTIQLALVIVAGMASRSHADTDNEKAVKAYYSGFETHNWNLVASQLADGFTFTTPLNDHLKIKDFKDTCWGTNKFTKKVDFIKSARVGDDLIVVVEIHTTDNKLVRNVDLYTFSGGKIKTIEVFFGPGESYPGNKKT